ncbi:MAG: HNH endonuclease [Oligoflexia bacterium]|nr:HNH endonuclease [Oligoflexia bacterium]
MNPKTNLKLLSDETLLRNTKNLVRDEREMLSNILLHLKEIQRRRLFSKEKCGSMYEYAMKELLYTEDQAYRRVQAMELLKEIPEIEEKINDGSLSLTHMGMAQSLLAREEKSTQKLYSREKKIALLKKFEKTTKKEAQKIMFSVSTISHKPTERIRQVSADQVEISFTVTDKILKKIQKLKGLNAHKNPNVSLAELFDQLCDIGLEKLDKSTAPARKAAEQSRSTKVKASTPQTTPSLDIAIQSQIKPNKPLSKAHIKRQVWRMANGQCQNCNSMYALEIDHKLPKALGGNDSLENLRLFCRSCNQRAAIEKLGQLTMEKYLGH